MKITELLESAEIHFGKRYKVTSDFSSRLWYFDDRRPKSTDQKAGTYIIPDEENSSSEITFRRARTDSGYNIFSVSKDVFLKHTQLVARVQK